MKQRKLKCVVILWLIFGSVAVALLIGLAFTHAKISELESIAASEGVPMYYVSAGAIEQYVGECANGFYDIEGNFIAVDCAQKLDARILAHELGHYYAIKYFGDKSEEVAEQIGRGLLRFGEKYLDGLR